jgi:hypothetical protein
MFYGPYLGSSVTLVCTLKAPVDTIQKDEVQIRQPALQILLNIDLTLPITPSVLGSAPSFVERARRSRERA